MSTITGTSDAIRDSQPAQTLSEVATVLVVDDSAFDRHLVCQLLQTLDDVRVVCTCNGREGHEAIAREAPAVILTDLSCPTSMAWSWFSASGPSILRFP